MLQIIKKLSLLAKQNTFKKSYFCGSQAVILSVMSLTSRATLLAE